MHGKRKCVQDTKSKCSNKTKRCRIQQTDCKQQRTKLNRRNFVDIRAPCRRGDQLLVVTSLALCRLLFPSSPEIGIASQARLHCRLVTSSLVGASAAAFLDFFLDVVHDVQAVTSWLALPCIVTCPPLGERFREESVGDMACGTVSCHCCTVFWVRCTTTGLPPVPPRTKP
jgi:hypothetical protein